MAAGAMIPGVPPYAQAVQAGSLSCHEAGGWGFVFGSSHDIHCTFLPVSGRPERYTGSISQFGVDIGYQQIVIIWGVLAPTTIPGPGALAGTYVGATASAAVGAGVGANVLVGGSNKSISLQPVSLEGGVGLNVAGGIAALTRPTSPEPPPQSVCYSGRHRSFRARFKHYRSSSA
jgi:hypothetical protein